MSRHHTRERNEVCMECQAGSGKIYGTFAAADERAGIGG
jgi:hypothetical protein